MGSVSASESAELSCGEERREEEADDGRRMLAGNATDPPNLNATITREVRWGRERRVLSGFLFHALLGLWCFPAGKVPSYLSLSLSLAPVLCWWQVAEVRRE